MVIGILELYQGKSGKKGYYNSQEVGLAKTMKKVGYDVVIFYPDSKIENLQEEIVEDKIRIVYCPAQNIGVHSRYDWSVLKKYNVDIVQIGSDNQLFAPDVLNYCKKNGILAYCYIGTIDSDTASGIKKIIMNVLGRRNIKSYKKCKCFAKTSEVKKQLSSRGVKNVDVAPVGLDTTIIPDITESQSSLKRGLGIPEKSLVLLYVGRIDGYKKPFDMVEIMKRFKSDNIIAVMIGTGNMDEALDESIKKNGLSERIIRIKQIKNREIHSYYRMADFFLNFNPKEIFGMSIMEAMYQGCTVIAHHAPGPDTIIENGADGYLVNNLEEMMEIIKKERQLDSLVISNAVNNKCSWEYTANKVNTWISGQLKGKVK